MDMITIIVSGRGKSRYGGSFQEKKHTKNQSVIMEGIKAENCEKRKML